MKKIRLQVVGIALLCAVASVAQTSVNFSGKWRLNTSKSKAAPGTSFAENSEAIMDIVQDQASMKITTTITNPGGVRSNTEAYALDGKEQVIKEDQLTTKKTGRWSADKKQIIITQIETMGKVEFRREDTYSLSDGGKILMIQSAQVMNARKGDETRVYEKK